jgi:hypothetical protein
MKGETGDHEVRFGKARKKKSKVFSCCIPYIEKKRNGHDFIR